MLLRYNPTNNFNAILSYVKDSLTTFTQECSSVTIYGIRLTQMILALHLALFL